MDTKLWALLIPGPDDLWAMPSKEAAEAAAKQHNSAVDSDNWPLKGTVQRSMCYATAVEWPYSAEEHAESIENELPELFFDCDT